MNPLKILFLSLLAIFLLPAQNLFAQYGYSSLTPKSDISLYPWETPDTSRPEEYCEDYSYSTDMSQVEVRFTKQNKETFEISCYDPQNSWMGDPQPMSYRFKPYTVTVTNYYGNNRPYEEYPQVLDQWCHIQEWHSQIGDLPNYTNYIRFTPIQIKSEGRLQINCENTMNGQLAQVEIYYKKDETQTPPPPPSKIPGCTNPNALNYDPQATEENGTCIEKIEGCTDSTAINYNPSANVHKESTCEYSQNTSPQDITGAFEKSQVSIGSTTWTLRFNLNVPDVILDPSTIQTWDHFTAVDSTTNDKTITITLRQFDNQRLDVECTNYEVTIPRHALTTTNGDTNPNPISGNFEVVGCDGIFPTNGSGSIDVNIGSGSIDVKNNANLNKESHYLQIIGQKDGFYYVDTKALMMLLFFLLITFSCFYALFKLFFKKIY